jgi:transcriptional regulator GlxA family with amidase domain
VEFVGLSRSVKAQNGEYQINTHKTTDEVKSTQLIIVPALYGDINEALIKNAPALEWLNSMRNKGAELASLCTGAFLLAETGLLDQKRCSTHWAYYEVFRAKYPTIDLIDGSVISDEAGIYSSGGANSLWNLLLYILEKYTDRDTAILAAKFFAIEIDRFDQSMFTIFNGQKNHNDTEILKAQEELESRFSERIVVNDLLESIAINRRTFERRFKNATNNTILEYLQRVRTEAAKRKFEGGRKNVNEVMYEVGYNDVKAFREVFKKFTGMSPVDYRGKYNKKTG